MIRFGFACKAVGLPGAAQTGLTLARANQESLIRVSRHNLGALGVMLRYCKAQSISLLRISSDVIPLASHPEVSFDWQTLLAPELAALRETIRDCGVRVSMHPGQYTVLNSPHAQVVQRAVQDLRFHAAFLDALGTGQAARLILHPGGGYGDREAALERLRENLQALPSPVRNRLSLENDERVYTIEDVLKICAAFSLPAVFDVFHHALNPPAHGSPAYWLDAAAATWDAQRGRPKIHYSQQLRGARPGMHSRTIRLREFLAFHAQLKGRELDVMLEVKDKNLSALKCGNLIAPDLPRTRLTEEWARYKYLILERDPAAYAAIRALLKAEQPKAESFYARIENALAVEATPGHARNAAQHVWGYLDKRATPAEAKRILSELQGLGHNPGLLPRLKRRLFALAEKQAQSYLLHSLYFYL